MVDKILRNLGFAGLVDDEDFYSLANEVFADVIKRYEGSRPFDGFLYSCLSNRFKTEMTKRNRFKRQADSLLISIDTPVGEEDVTLGDIIPDRFNVETVIFGDDNPLAGKIEQYLDRLSKKQKRIVGLLADSYGAGEIQKILHITPKEYSDALNGIHAYENVSMLF